MRRFMVIGIGSRIMGDDGIGVYVVEELIKQQFFNGIEYVIGETDIDYCLDCIGSDNESLIIIIDAAMSGNEPGTVTEFASTDMALCTSIALFAHNKNLIEVVSRQLQDCDLRIIGIEPELVDFKCGLSDALRETFEVIMEDVKKCLQKSVVM